MPGKPGHSPRSSPPAGWKGNESGGAHDAVAPGKRSTRSLSSWPRLAGTGSWPPSGDPFCLRVLCADLAARMATASPGAPELYRRSPQGNSQRRADVCQEADERLTMARCITCGARPHPERARKYSYCMDRACQEKNATGLTMVAVGMNKAADELLILDQHTREDLASGKYHDQRRGSFGTPATPPASGAAVPSGQPARRSRPRPAPALAPARHPWTQRFNLPRNVMRPFARDAWMPG